MTRKDIIDQLQRLDGQGQHQWLIRLGSNFTVCAPAGYPDGDNPGKMEHLIGFNELQHQLYHYLRDPNGDWSLESLLDTLFGTAKRFGIEGDAGWALMNSLGAIE
jgi:hypothetical protein